MWKLVFTKQASKDSLLIKNAGLKAKTSKLLEIIKSNPFQNPPQYEKLKGELFGLYSRRINKQHRIVYQVYEELKIVKIIRLWTHYE